jgi:hypothetical protein
MRGCCAARVRNTARARVGARIEVRACLRDAAAAGSSVQGVWGRKTPRCPTASSRAIRTRYGMFARRQGAPERSRTLEKNARINASAPQQRPGCSCMGHGRHAKACHIFHAGFPSMQPSTSLSNRAIVTVRIRYSTSTRKRAAHSSVVARHHSMAALRCIGVVPQASDLSDLSNLLRAPELLTGPMYGAVSGERRVQNPTVRSDRSEQIQRSALAQVTVLEHPDNAR